MSNKESKAMDTLIKKFLMYGARIILGALVAGLIPFSLFISKSITDLRAQDLVINTKLESNSSSIGAFKKQVDDLHWFLIRSNNVKIPKKK